MFILGMETYLSNDMKMCIILTYLVLGLSYLNDIQLQYLENAENLSHNGMCFYFIILFYLLTIEGHQPIPIRLILWVSVAKSRKVPRNSTYQRKLPN